MLYVYIKQSTRDVGLLSVY